MRQYSDSSSSRSTSPALGSVFVKSPKRDKKFGFHQSLAKSFKDFDTLRLDESVLLNPWKTKPDKDDVPDGGAVSCSPNVDSPLYVWRCDVYLLPSTLYALPKNYPPGYVAAPRNRPIPLEKQPTWFRVDMGLSHGATSARSESKQIDPKGRMKDASTSIKEHLARAQNYRILLRVGDCAYSKNGELVLVQTELWTASEGSLRWIEIKSPSLIEALKSLTVNYPWQTLQKDPRAPVRLVEPFEPVLGSLDLLEDFLAKGDSQASNHVQFLLDTIKEIQPEHFKYLVNIKAGNAAEVDFEMLWLLYRPETMVLTDRFCGHTVYQAFRVHATSSNNSSRFVMTLRFHAHEDNDTPEYALNHCYHDVIIERPDRDTNLSIKDSEFRPLSYVPDSFRVMNNLKERGQRYLDLCSGPEYLETFTEGDREQRAQWQERNDRVVVDFSFHRYEPQGGESQGAHKLFTAVPDCRCLSCMTARYDHAPISDGPMPIQTLRRSVTRPLPRTASGAPPMRRAGNTMASPPIMPKSLQSPMKKRKTLIRTELELCIGIMTGFSLSTKSPGEYLIDSLRKPEFDQNVIDKVVVNSKHLKVVSALVRSYLDGGIDFSDLVKGKGRGLVILLHGSPGIGKTLFAETVAEAEHCPLYPITSGDLGINARDLEISLQHHLALASRWRAIVLLDEADVFLQERDVRNLTRNALVSVFLRELEAETFDGVLFMTTNRPGLLDEAFQSRIHVAIALPHLDAMRQAKVWYLFLKDHVQDKQSVKHIVKKLVHATKEDGLNGRQIRNSVRSALALAAREKEELSLEHLLQVVSLSSTFTKYMKDLNGMDMHQKQDMLGLRSVRDITESNAKFVKSHRRGSDASEV